MHKWGVRVYSWNIWENGEVYGLLGVKCYCRDKGTTRDHCKVDAVYLILRWLYQIKPEKALGDSILLPLKVN